MSSFDRFCFPSPLQWNSYSKHTLFNTSFSKFLFIYFFDYLYDDQASYLIPNLEKCSQLPQKALVDIKGKGNKSQIKEREKREENGKGKGEDKERMDN